jgi:hemolysin activation/secretion protein
MHTRSLLAAALLFACLPLPGAESVGVSEAPRPETPQRLLRQILIADTIEGAQKLEFVEPGEFIVVSSPALAQLDRAELAKRLQAGKGRPINDRLLAGIAQVVEVFVKQSGFAIATAIIPPQNIAAGAIRVAVLPGKVRNIRFEGNRWFSESMLRERLRIDRGGLVQVSELDRSLAWTNFNQFRRVRLHVQPVPETGEADLLFNVQERFPLRLSLGYENTGNEILGFDRYTASLSYGNLWGRDHQVSLQEVFSHSTKLFRVHAFDYRAPLPWRHVVSVSGSYALVNPTFYSGLFTQQGKSVNADLRYVVPVRAKGWEGEISGSASFKQSNNNLEFGGVSALGTTNDLFSASLSASAVRADSRGRWIVSTTLTGSPGSLNSRNDEDNFNDVRPGAKPRYAFAQLWVQRLTALAPRVTSVARVSAQLASTNLVPSEQIAAGGANTVRGYEERVLAGDGGFLATHELQWNLPSTSLGKRLPALETALAFFWDYGRTVTKHPLIGDEKAAYLASVGLGLRCSITNHLSATADFARQLEEVELPGVRHHRLHVKVTLAF